MKDGLIGGTVAAATGATGTLSMVGTIPANIGILACLVGILASLVVIISQVYNIRRDRLQSEKLVIEIDRLREDK